MDEVGNVQNRLMYLQNALYQSVATLDVLVRFRKQNFALLDQMQVDSWDQCIRAMLNKTSEHAQAYADVWEEDGT